MEQKERDVISIEQVNNFKYIIVNKVKYFIGDQIILKDGPVHNNRPVKYKIIGFVYDSIDKVFLELNSSYEGHSIIPATSIKEFYYKKDIRKYVDKKTPRIYEAPLDKEVNDYYGNKGLITDMILVDYKLVLKSACVEVFHSNNPSDGSNWLLKENVTNEYSVTKCDITGKYYYNYFITRAKEAKNPITDSRGKLSFQIIDRYINNEEAAKLLTASVYTFNNNFDNDVYPILNGDEILKTYPDMYALGPKSGQIILKSQLKQDGYRRYDSGLYFPEFKALKKLKEGDNKFNYKFGLDSPTHLITEGLKYTFGVEIEMADCAFTLSMQKDFNIMVEKDGSIKNTRGEKYGPEVITGVLKGDCGFNHLQDICNDLAKKGEINHTCGIHVHVGSADFNNTNVVLLYKLLKYLENEIFNMLPKSRRNNEYCRTLPNLDFNFDGCTSIMDLKIRVDNYYTELFTKAANSPPDNKYNKNTNHPKGAKVGYDHSNIRYCWANFIPTLFNTRNAKPPVYTIEFRCFNASTNFTKIKNWIKICMALVNFAENNHSDIMSNCVTINGEVLNLTLKNVMMKVYPKSYRILNEFIDFRTELFNSEIDDIKNEGIPEEKLTLKQLI